MFAHRFVPVITAFSLLVSISAAKAQNALPSVVVPLPAKALLYDPVSKKIYATIGSKGAGATVNSVTAIDPVTGKIGASVFVGDKPGIMTLSANSKYIYVSVNDGSGVRRVDIAGMTAGPLYSMTGKPVRAILPVPGAPESFIALRGNDNQYDDALGIYAEGKLKGNEARCAIHVASGITPTRIYTYQSRLSSWDFDGYDAKADDIQHISHSQSVMTGAIGFVGTINGLILASNGGVIDPETRQTIGHLNFNDKPIATLLPDSRTGCVFSISEAGDGQEIAACNLSNYQYIGTYPLQFGVKGGAGSPIRWEEDGFAYTAGDRIVIFRMNPGKVLPAVDLAVERSPLPDTLPRDNKLHYQLTVTNKGTQPASAVFVSDALPESADVLTTKASQGNVTAADGIVRGELGPLAAGAKATIDVDLQFKEVKEVRFTTVVRGYEPDPNTENNIVRIAPSDSISALADLTGEWDGVRQFSAGAGTRLEASISGNFIVRNSGKLSSRPTTVRFYVCPEPQFDASYSLLLQEVSLPRIRPGNRYTVNLNAPLGRGGDITGLQVFAVIDADGEIEEATKTNNIVGTRIP